MSDDIDKLIEETLGITEEDFYAGHSTRFDDLRAVAKAARNDGYAEGLNKGAAHARRELAREALAKFRATVPNGVAYETWLREIAEEMGVVMSDGKCPVCSREFEDYDMCMVERETGRQRALREVRDAFRSYLAACRSGFLRGEPAPPNPTTWFEEGGRFEIAEEEA